MKSVSTSTKSLMLIALLCTGVGSEAEAYVRLSGFASAYGEYNSVPIGTRPRPETIARFRLRPTLTISGIPIHFDIFLTSAESRARQALSKYRVLLRPRQIPKNVPVPGILRSIHSLEVGTCYPHYSPLTLSGIPVTGGAIDLNFWKVYLAAAGGRIKRAVVGSDTTDVAHKRMLYAGRLGIGRPDGSHLFFTGMMAEDDAASIPRYETPVGEEGDSVELVKPMENYLGAVEMKLLLFNNRLTLESEVVGSQFNRDSRLPELTPPEMGNWERVVFRPRMSTGIDYAYSVKSSFDMSATRLWGSVHVIGPGFYSVGAPNLRNDNLSYEGGVNQNLFSNSLSLSVSHRRERDNLTGLKESTTYFTSYALNARAYFRGLPYFTVTYTPYRQNNDHLGIDNRIHIASFNVGHSFTALGLSNSPAISYSYQRNRGRPSKNDYTYNSVTVSHGIGFRFPLRFSANVGHTRTVYTDRIGKITLYGANASYTLFKKWTNTLGFNITSSGGDESRKGARFNSSVSLPWGGNFNFSAERNMYRGAVKQKDYNEWRVQSFLSQHW